MYKPGQSGNPKGRPRTGLAVAERIRERVDPDLVIDLVMRYAADEGEPLDKRIDKVLALIDRGYIKPPTAIAARIEQVNMPQRDLSAIPLETRRAMLEALRAAPRIVNSDDDES